MDSDGSEWRDSCPKTRDRHFHLLYSKELSDVVFLVGENQKPIKAHKFILIVASPVFEIEFSERWNKDIQIKIPDVTPKAFQIFLEFLYTDKLSIVTVNEAHDVLLLADTYQVIFLAEKCLDFLDSKINVKNVTYIHQVAIKFSQKCLEKKAMEFLLKNGNAVFEDNGFLEIDIDTLTTILKDDNLATYEITVFRAVMRWAENKCEAKKLEFSVKNVRTILKDLIRLIRFTLMSPEDFTNEVTMGKYEGILSDVESHGIFKHLIAGSSMRAHLPTIPFNLNERYGLPYKVDMFEHLLAYIMRDSCRIHFRCETQCEITIGLISNRSISVQGIELRHPIYIDCQRQNSTTSYLILNESSAGPSNIFASITDANRSNQLLGTFQPKIFSKLTGFEGGVHIEKGRQYNIKFVINRNGWTELGPSRLLRSWDMNFVKVAKVPCQKRNVDFNFTIVSTECCRPDVRDDVNCVCYDLIKTLHFTL